MPYKIDEEAGLRRRHRGGGVIRGESGGTRHYHGWSSPAEVMALEVLKQDFEIQGPHLGRPCAAP